MDNLIIRLRRELEAEFTRLIDAAFAREPTVDGVTMCTLLMLHGVEIGLTVGKLDRSSIAKHVREIADALDDREMALPTLGRIASEGSDDPAF